MSGVPLVVGHWAFCPLRTMAQAHQVTSVLADVGMDLLVPTLTPCSSDDDLVKPVHPSTSNEAECLAWRKQEFNAAEVTPHSYDLATRAPVSSCRETCDIPTQVGTAIITPGCTDLDDGSGFCPFYTRHFDACGKYDEDESLCCACGGGKTTTTTTTTPPSSGVCAFWVVHGL